MVGDLTYNDSTMTGVGVEIFSIDSIDLSGFWASDPSRTSTEPTDATVESDISDYAIGLWLFNYPGSITFGALDAGDTVTFTDGVLTSIDLSISTTFNVDTSAFLGFPLNFDGSFNIAGNGISYEIDDSLATPGQFWGDSIDMQADIFGTVNAVAVPEPHTYALIAGVAVLGLVVLRRRR